MCSTTDQLAHRYDDQKKSGLKMNRERERERDERVRERGKNINIAKKIPLVPI